MHADKVCDYLVTVLLGAVLVVALVVMVILLQDCDDQGAFVIWANATGYVI